MAEVRRDNLPNGRVGVVKQIVQISNPRLQGGASSRNVVIRHQMFDSETGLAIGGPEKVGTIQFDREITTVEKVFNYAKTRKWGFESEPNTIGQFTPIDEGPLEVPEVTTTTGGAGAAAPRSQSEVRENEIVK